MELDERHAIFLGPGEGEQLPGRLRELHVKYESGEFEVLGESIPILGLRTTARILEQVTPALPPSLRPSLEQVTEFATQARDNLDVAKPLIDRLAQPIKVDKVVVGDAPETPQMSEAAAALFRKALSTDRAQRPSAALAFLTACEQALV